MTTFNVLASTAYRLSITEPTVAGNPAPTISYAWSYNGTPIGGNNRIVNAYTFPSLPGTLSCTVTATNWGGSVSETATATIAEQQAVPVLDAVSIRVSSAPTVIVTDLPGATAGTVLTVGGDRPASTAPTGTNIGTLAYQWRRNGDAIAGATDQAYTLVASDIDTTISVEVTASNAGASDTEYAVVRVGNAAANANSRIGGHGPDVNYFTSSGAFVNLSHSIPPWVDGVFGKPLSSVASASADGWRFTPEVYLIVVNAPTRLSALGIPGAWNVANPNAGITDNYRVRYKITVYWEGAQGKAVMRDRGVYGGANDQAGSRTAEQSYEHSWDAYSATTVQFTNGDPFGQGVTRDFFKRTTTFGPVSVQALQDHSVSVYANGASDPFRNAVILVHDVEREVGGTGSGVWETVYEGFTHENYTPFALYPSYVEAMRHFKALRFLTFGWASTTENSTDTGTAITGLNYPYSAAFNNYRDLPTSFTASNGVSYGFGAINSPTHVNFGRSLVSACKLCSALGCDLWWNHPFPSTFVGNSSGEIQLRTAYLDLFAATVNQHLAPGLKVYSEWSNETWNTDSPYSNGKRYAENQGSKLANASGELVLRNYGAFASNAWWSDCTIAADVNGNLQNLLTAGFAYNAASSAAITEYLRPRMVGREIVSIWAGQDSGGSLRHELRKAGMAIFKTLPGVFDELDAYAVAPYREPPVDFARVESGTLDETGIFDEAQAAGWLLPWTDPSSKWRTNVVNGADNTRNGFVLQKLFAIDAIAGDERFVLNADLGKRRWNLRLVAYECGQHHTPATATSREVIRRLQYEPRYYDFYYRHYETLLSAGPSPNVTVRQPDGYFGVKTDVSQNAEPLYDLVCDLAPIQRHVVNFASFWGTQQFIRETGAPRAEALRQLVLDQPWSNA